MKTKTMPHSDVCERAVLASVLLDSEALAKVSESLPPEAFYSERNRLIFEAMTRVADESIPDLATVQAELDRRGELERVGGVAYLAGLDLDLPDISRLQEYIAVVRERDTRRRVIELCARLTKAMLESNGDLSQSLGESQRQLAAAMERATPRRFVALEEAYERVLGELDEKQGPSMTGLKTGFHDFDRLAHGLKRGKLIIVAGRPSMGKTTFATNIAQNVAIEQGKRVAMFSLEMGAEELATRILASEAQVSAQLLANGMLSRKKWSRIVQAVKRTGSAPLLMDDSGYNTLQQVLAKCRALAGDGGLDLVVVDYLQLMTTGRRHENRNLEVSTMSRAFKQLALELEIPIILVSQLSRETERRGGAMRPRLSDLRESGALEQDADLVAFIYRAELYDEETADAGIAEVIVAKHRNGRPGTARLVFLGDHNRFANLAHADDPSPASLGAVPF